MFAGGPHAALVDKGELRLASLPGRSRLWLVVLPGVLAARGLQEVVPESWPAFSVYVVLVLAAFYLGDRWSTHTTQAAFAGLTADDVAREPDVRLALDDIVRVAERDRVFGGPELRIETADDTLRLAGDPAPVERLKARLPDSVLADDAA